MKNYLLSGIAATALIFTSCGKKIDTGVEKDDLKPNEAMSHWLKDAEAGRVGSLWDSMPESYQKDVQGLAREFGAKIDSEVYDEAMKTMGGVSDLLQDKKDIILAIMDENSAAIGEESAGAVKENYDAVVKLIDAVVNSQIKDTEGLKELEIAEFLGEIQDECKGLAKVLNSVVGDDLKKDGIKLVSEEGDSAVVEDPSSEGGEKTVKLKRVGNRWLPAEMVEDWDKNMDEARKGLSEMEKMSEVDKQKALGVMRTVQATVKELQGAKNKEEFMKKVEESAAGFGGLF